LNTGDGILVNDLKTSSTVLLGIIKAALKLGVDIQFILRQFGIPVNLDHITQSTIDLKQVHAIVMAVEKAGGHPALGLLTGEDFDFEYFPHLKSFVMSSSTLREAFESIRPIQKLISPLLTLHLEETGKVAIIKFQPDGMLYGEDERHYSEMIFTCIKTITNRLMNKTIPPKSIHFRHSRSELTPLYQNFFGSVIVLNAPENAIIYDSAIIDIPLPGGFPEIRRQAGNIVNHQLGSSPLYGGLVEDLKRLLAARSDLLNAPIEQVAHALNVSARTLQRRMAENGHSITEIRDLIRFKLAIQALQSKRYSIEEIAEKLGFSDRHCLTQAFKRWSGLSPIAYRKKLTI
jgi:AraC-like DNA-binding protein